MKLSKSIVYVITITFLSLGLFLYIIFQTLLLSEFRKIGILNTEDNIKRIYAAFENKITNQISLNRDWAQWDDTVNYLKNRNNNYQTANLTYESLEPLELSHIIYFDENNNVIKAIEVLTEKKTVKQINLGLIEEIKNKKEIIQS